MPSQNEEVGLDQLSIGETIGQGGSCRVRVASGGNGSKFAMKIYSKVAKFESQIKAEIEALSIMKHPRLVNMTEHGQGLTKKQKPFSYVLLELLTGGTLFELAAHTGRFQEAYARHFFIQLIEGISYIHAAGFCHRDIKPENLMLDDNLDLKITDFGFSTPCYSANGQVMLRDSLGTAGFMAPELHSQADYTGYAVDTFAAGITLFTFVAGRRPFVSAKKDDPHYSMLATDPVQFWQLHVQDCGAIFSTEFRDLFMRMTLPNPAMRPQLDEVLAHPWVQGVVPSRTDVQREFAYRQALLASLHLQQNQTR